MSGKKIYLIGCGPGSRAYLTPMAMDLVSKAGVVIGPKKFTDLFDSIPGRIIPARNRASLILEDIERYFREKDIALLVSGDPGCFSLSRLVVDRFGLQYCRIIPGISSVQLALARLGLEWTEARVLSVHGREPAQAAGKIFESELCVVLLAGDMGWIAPFLEQIRDNRTIYLMQDLGLQGEKISIIKTSLDLEQKISSSSLVVINRKQDRS